jgi:non-ribosomal peptide synthetase component F
MNDVALTNDSHMVPLQLPAALAAALQAEAARTLEPAGIPPRSAPEWGQQIFSERCVLVSPTGADDVDAFVQYAVAALGVYVQAAASAVPCDPEGMRQVRPHICTKCDGPGTSAALKALIERPKTAGGGRRWPM